VVPWSLATSTTPLSTPPPPTFWTMTGVGEFVCVPLPTSPLKLYPHDLTVPSAISAYPPVL
jgi:hypothetical protein